MPWVLTLQGQTLEGQTVQDQVASPRKGAGRASRSDPEILAKPTVQQLNWGDRENRGEDGRRGRQERGWEKHKRVDEASQGDGLGQAVCTAHAGPARGTHRKPSLASWHGARSWTSAHRSRGLGSQGVEKRYVLMAWEQGVRLEGRSPDAGSWNSKVRNPWSKDRVTSPSVTPRSPKELTKSTLIMPLPNNMATVNYTACKTYPIDVCPPKNTNDMPKHSNNRKIISDKGCANKKLWMLKERRPPLAPQWRVQPL